MYSQDLRWEDPRERGEGPRDLLGSFCSQRSADPTRSWRLWEQQEPGPGSKGRSLGFCPNMQLPPGDLPHLEGKQGKMLRS